jgi:hypothetical protein
MTLSCLHLSRLWATSWRRRRCIEISKNIPTFSHLDFLFGGGS